ncbi:hypothetical protein GCM10027029_32710 [Conyzicola lurida]
MFRLILMYILLSALFFALVLGAIIDIVVMDESRVKHLPKMVWIILVVLLPVIGSIAWFAVGHGYDKPVDRGTFGDPRRYEQPQAGPEYGFRPRSTEEELAALEREIEFHEKQDRIKRLEAQLNEKRAQTD